MDHGALAAYNVSVITKVAMKQINHASAFEQTDLKVTVYVELPKDSYMDQQVD